MWPNPWHHSMNALVDHSGGYNDHNEYSGAYDHDGGYEEDYNGGYQDYGQYGYEDQYPEHYDNAEYQHDDSGYGASPAHGVSHEAMPTNDSSKGQVDQSGINNGTHSNSGTGNGTSGKKRGIGWPYNKDGGQFSLFQSPNISWCFNWESWVPKGLPTDGSMEWVPTIHKEQDVQKASESLKQASGQGVKFKYLLGFNEPDNTAEANLPPEKAAQLWKESILPLKQEYQLKLGSPGMTSDMSKCKPWLDSFMGAIGGADGVDFLVLHWYGKQFQEMKSFLEEMHSTYKLPIWLNEFACTQASESEVQSFMKESLAWLEQSEFIERYAYFGNGDDAAMGFVGQSNSFCKGDSLSSVGQMYVHEGASGSSTGAGENGATSGGQSSEMH